MRKIMLISTAHIYTLKGNSSELHIPLIKIKNWKQWTEIFETTMGTSLNDVQFIRAVVWQYVYNTTPKVNAVKHEI